MSVRKSKVPRRRAKAVRMRKRVGNSVALHAVQLAKRSAPPCFVGDPAFDARTVREAREWVWARRASLPQCPCCSQLVHRYTRSVSAQVAKFLIGVYRFFKRNPGVQWASNRDVFQAGEKASSDASRMVIWGLLERHPTSAGLWRLTARGRAFVLGRLRVPTSALVTVGHVESFSVTTTNIREALGRQFDYHTLMWGAW